MPRRTDRPTFLASDRLLARRVAQPVARFLAVEAAGGVVLVAAAVVALVWANSPWRASYETLWSTDLTLALGHWSEAHDLRHWINDGLMAVFFFVVGVEVKAELTTGHLADRRAAAFPIAAALGGMAVPALLYLALNGGGDSASGWGIPMATDIAFALGVVALAGDRVPASIKVALLGIAVVDDIGAIVVIAAFYSDGLEPTWGLAALAGLALVAGLRRARVWYLPVYGAVGVAVWFATLQSGVHATIAGVALGLLVPVRPLLGSPDADAIAQELSDDEDVTAADVRDVSFRIRESVPLSERALGALHPWSSYAIVPLFALANAGVEVSASALADAATTPLSLGVVIGLVVGKPLGIVGVGALVVRLGLARAPAQATSWQVLGLGVVAGVGFTVSIFIAGLAFDPGARVDQAKLAVLLASIVASVAGLLLLRTAPDPTAGRGGGRR
jgi:NhaA family Na+:H+ antiporter